MTQDMKKKLKRNLLQPHTLLQEERKVDELKSSIKVLSYF